MKYLLALFLLVMNLGCERVELRPKSTPPVSDEKSQAFVGDYVKDGKGGLFQNVKWYEYEMATHIIWTRFDAFVIRSENQNYKIQVRAYYDTRANEPGLFQLAVAKGSAMGQNIEVDARACGNPFTNPDHAACLTDPNRNVFTYLYLRTMAQRKMTDEQSRQDREWDIAFRGTDVKLNAGTSGPGDVVGALLSRFDYFNENGAVSLTKLRDPVLKARAWTDFDGLDANAVRSFYLPDGIDRVMHERDWFSIDPASQKRVARADQWWILKSPVDDAYVKVRVASIQESTEGTAAFETHLTFESSLQEPGASSFASSVSPLKLNFTTDARSTQFCISFVKAESWTCTKDRTDWDLRLLVVNQIKGGALNREWRIFVNEAARGPLTTDEAAAVTTGR